MASAGDDGGHTVRRTTVVATRSSTGVAASLGALVDLADLRAVGLHLARVVVTGSVGHVGDGPWAGDGLIVRAQSAPVVAGPATGIAPGSPSAGSMPRSVPLCSLARSIAARVSRSGYSPSASG